MSVTVERLRELLDYSPETGQFTWKKLSNRKDLVGKTAGSKAHKYIQVFVDGKKGIMAHRLAWFWVYGQWPTLDLDHINGDGCDNRISNLREATPSENGCNSRIRKDSRTGFKGVFRKGSKFAAHIRKNGAGLYLGTFKTPQEAHAAYCEAARRLHGTFAHMGG